MIASGLDYERKSYFEGTVQDITERKIAEEAMEKIDRIQIKRGPPQNQEQPAGNFLTSQPPGGEVQ